MVCYDCGHVFARVRHHLFRGMPGVWKSRHRLVLCWLIVMQALFPGRKTLAELARWTPAIDHRVALSPLAEGRLLGCPSAGRVVGQEALQTLPPPEDGTLYLVGDGSDKPKRGTQNPLAQKGRKSQHDPWFFGVRFALFIVSWDVYRLPVAFRLIRPKSHPEYQTENELFREMVRHFARRHGPEGHRRRRCGLWLARQYEDGAAAGCR